MEETLAKKHIKTLLKYVEMIEEKGDEEMEEDEKVLRLEDFLLQKEKLTEWIQEVLLDS